MEKKENNLFTQIIKVQILFARTIVTSIARASFVFLLTFSINQEYKRFITNAVL